MSIYLFWYLLIRQANPRAKKQKETRNAWQSLAYSPRGIAEMPNSVTE